MVVGEWKKLDYVLKFVTTPEAEMAKQFAEGKRVLDGESDTFFNGLFKIKTFKHESTDIKKFTQFKQKTAPKTSPALATAAQRM